MHKTQRLFYLMKLATIFVFFASVVVTACHPTPSQPSPTVLTATLTMVPISTWTLTPRPTLTAILKPTSTPTLAKVYRLIFPSNRSGTIQVFAINSDGSNLVQLTSSTALAYAPQVSPDGKLIAYLVGTPPELFIMSVDGSNQTQITDQATFKANLAWSPNSQRIAYECGQKPATASICLADLTTLTSIYLTSTGRDREPVWSPDGQKIAFTSWRDGNYEVYVMNSDGSEQTNLTRNETDDRDAIWSPDGTQIAFVSFRNDTVQLYLMSADGELIGKLTDTPVYKHGLSWSPDGSEIAFTAHIVNEDHIGHDYLFTVDIRSSHQQQVLENEYHNYAPEWSSDGRIILFTTEWGQRCLRHYGIGVVDMATLQWTELSSDAVDFCTDYYPEIGGASWLP